MANFPIPPRIPFTDANGIIAREWNRYLYDLFNGLQGVPEQVRALVGGTGFWRSIEGALQPNASAVDLSGIDAIGTLAAARFPAIGGDIGIPVGTLVATLPAGNPNVGSFTNADLTVNAKGQITAVANGATGGVSNVSNADGTLIISPTTGVVVASLNVGHANTWSATQTFGAVIATTFNGNTITTGTGTLTIGAGKVVTFSNTLTFTGTDASSVNFGAGGTVLYAGGGVGTVTSVSVVTANGVSGSVATPTSTPAITLTLGAITPSSVAASGTVTGSNLSGTNTGDQTSVSGNAGTATALQTPRTINGVSFDGTANITVPAAAGTLTGATLAAGVTASSLWSAAGGTFGTAAFTPASAYEVPLTFSTGLTRTVNTVTVNTSQNIAKLSNLTGNGYVKTSGGDGTLSASATVAVGDLSAAIDLSATGAGGATGILAAGRFPALTGDVTTVAGALASTLATVNANVGTFGSATQVAVVTLNAKGLATAASNVPIAITAGAVTGVMPAFTAFI